MQTSGEKLTIAEFATRAGCSTQRIYQLLHNSLQEFAIVENGRKYILSDGLPIVLEARKKQGFTKSNSADSPTLDKSLQESETAEKVAELTAELEKAKQANTAQTLTIERLTGNCERMRQTAEQDRQRAAAADAERKRADAAEAQLAVKDQQIAAQNERLAELTAALQSAQRQAESLTEALTAAQALHAGTLQRIGEKPSQEPVNAQESHQEAEHEDPAPTTEPPPRSSQKKAAEPAGAAPSGSEAGDRKRGLFSRLFRKHK